jgi:hypothetical protein
VALRYLSSTGILIQELDEFDVCSRNEEGSNDASHLLESQWVEAGLAERHRGIHSFDSGIRWKSRPS